MKENKIWHESLYKNFGQYFLIDKIIYSKKTKYQDLLIFDNSEFGRIMALDGIVQTTEKDEFIYHEMISHVPLIMHENPKNVLIIGGGDAGVLREISVYNTIENITLVEIDNEVINLSKKYLTKKNTKHFKDKRLEIIISDGMKFVENTNKKFDIIISDAPDPIGVGKNIFSKNFYEGCYNCLNKNGIFVSQNGVCFLQIEEAISTYKNLSKFFKNVKFYQASIPSYYGGIMLFSFASNFDFKLNRLNLNSKKNIINNCKYYNFKIHKSSFSLPQYFLNKLFNL